MGDKTSFVIPCLIYNLLKNNPAIKSATLLKMDNVKMVVKSKVAALSGYYSKFLLIIQVLINQVNTLVVLTLNIE